jgi:phosphatidylglycerol:prolipoprotein diacylglycerol transferase
MGAMIQGTLWDFESRQAAAMRQTLFIIPYEVGGVPLLGEGLLLLAWGVVSAGVLAYLVRKFGVHKETQGALPLILVTGLAIWVLPRLFPGGLPIRGYGVMVVLGVLAGVGLALQRAGFVGVRGETISSLACWMLVTGIVGARLFHVVEYWGSDYRSDTAWETLKAVLNVPQGGLVVYGALFGAMIGFGAIVSIYRLPALVLADLIAPSLAVGLAIGRIGCLLNGCCYGGICEWPWAVTFPSESPPFKSQVALGETLGFALGAVRDAPPVVARVRKGSDACQQGLRPGDVLLRVNGTAVKSSADAQQMFTAVHAMRGPVTLDVRGDRQIGDRQIGDRQIVLPPPPHRARSLPVHPTQIYSSVAACLLGLFLWSYYPFRRRDGEVIALLLTIYPMVRVLLEAIRVDEPPMWGTGLSISQNISLLVLAAAPLVWIYVWRQPMRTQVPMT